MATSGADRQFHRPHPVRSGAPTTTAYPSHFLQLLDTWHNNHAGFLRVMCWLVLSRKITDDTWSMLLQTSFLSHNVYGYKWKFKVWINETKTSLNLNSGCILSSKLNYKCWISFCLNLIEPFYSWSVKLDVVDFSKKNHIAVFYCRSAVLTNSHDRWVDISNSRLPIWSYRLAVYFQKPTKQIWLVCSC